MLYIEAEGKGGRDIGQMPVITNMKRKIIEKELNVIKEIKGKLSFMLRELNAYEGSRLGVFSNDKQIH